MSTIGVQGVQVVYIGGIEPTLDEALYDAAGRDVNDEGCTLQGEQRRDMFWRCESEEESTTLACRLTAVEHSIPFTVAIKSEDEHFEEKMLAVEASLPLFRNRNPRRRMSRRFRDEHIWREFMCAVLSREKLPRHVGEAFSDVALAARFADEAYKEYRERFPVREPEIDDAEPSEQSQPGARPQ